MKNYNNPQEIVRFYGSKNVFDFSYKELDYIQVHKNKISTDYSRLWANKGYYFGEVVCSPDRKYSLVKIPKNASTFMVNHLVDLGWTQDNIIDDPFPTNFIVILRDPVDRWLSGMVEYLMMYHEQMLGFLGNSFDYEFWPLIGERLGLSILFERLTFDDHTERQCNFLTPITFDTTTWFNFDNNLNYNISNFLTSIGYNNSIADAEKINSSEKDDDVSILKRKLKETLTYIMSNDPFKKYNVEQWMWCDTELIQQVKFYQANV